MRKRTAFPGQARFGAKIRASPTCRVTEVAERAPFAEDPVVRRAIFVFGFSFFGVGCGAGGMPPAEPASPAPAPGMPGEIAPRSPEEAQQRIDHARSEIDRATSKSAPEHPSTDVAPNPPTKPPSDPLSAGAASPCSTPCRALGSMRRAVESLCELTGTSDARCVNAKRTLVESQTKVGPCSCE